MSESEPLTPGEQEFERAMSGLNPSRPSLDALSIAFDAGKASAVKSRRMWQVASGILLLSTLTMLSIRTQREASLRSGASEVNLAKVDSRGAQLAGYVAFRNDVLDRGVIALPQSQAEPVLSPLRAGMFDTRKL